MLMKEYDVEAPERKTILLLLLAFVLMIIGAITVVWIAYNIVIEFFLTFIL